VRPLRAGLPDAYSSVLCPVHAVSRCRCLGGRGPKRLLRALQDGDVVDTDTARKGTLTYYQWCARALPALPDCRATGRPAACRCARARCPRRRGAGASPGPRRRGAGAGPGGMPLAWHRSQARPATLRSGGSWLPCHGCAPGVPAWRERVQGARQRCAGCVRRPLTTHAGAPGVPQRQVR